MPDPDAAFAAAGRIVARRLQHVDLRDDLRNQQHQQHQQRPVEHQWDQRNEQHIAVWPFELQLATRDVRGADR